jgi:hypothetical protein
MCHGKFLVGLALLAVFAVGVGNLHGEELYYHTNTYNSSVTNFPGTGYPVAVKFDLPVLSQTYEITSFGVLSQGDEIAFPTNTKIAVRVWNSSGIPLYSSDPLDLSGNDASLAMRWFNIASDHVQVSDSFYVGYQDLTGTMHFGYLVDVPSGNNYGRSYRYKVSDGTWSSGSEDLWFNVTVSIVPEPTAQVLLSTALLGIGGIFFLRRKQNEVVRISM